MSFVKHAAVSLIVTAAGVALIFRFKAIRNLVTGLA